MFEDPIERPVTAKEPLLDKGTGGKIKSRSSISGHGLQIALFLVGAAMTIVACIGLAAAWSQLDTVSRVLNVVNVVQMSLATIVEGVTLILDIFITTSRIASSVCAWAGPILAILTAMLIWESKQPPPLSPVEN